MRQPSSWCAVPAATSRCTSSNARPSCVSSVDTSRFPEASRIPKTVRARAGTPPRPVTPEGRGAVLFTCYAVAGSFALYPCEDIIHAFMALPAFLPLLALHLQRLHASVTGRARLAAAIYAGVLGALLALPSVARFFVTG